MVESTNQAYQETSAEEIAHLIIMLEHRRDDAHQIAKLLYELGEKASTKMLVDPAIGTRLQ